MTNITDFFFVFVQFGWTPLHHAARVGNLDLCKLLVKHYAKLDIRNKVRKMKRWMDR